MYTVTLATAASDAPAASSMARTLRNASRVCAAAPLASAGRVPGAAGGRKPSCPETKMKPLARTAC